MNPVKKTARIAGLWYVAIAVFYLFGMEWIDKTYFASASAEATIKTIQASSLLFRLGFVSCLVGHICFLFLANALYKLFRPVNADLSRLMVLLIVAGVSVSFLARLNQAAAMLLLDGKGYLSAFPPAQLESLAMFFLDLLRQGESMAVLFWALWLLPLGLLVIKSGFIPKVLGILLLCACASYLVDFLNYFFFPRFSAVVDAPFSAIQMVAEISFLLWLLVVGVKNPETPRTKNREMIAGQP